MRKKNVKLGDIVLIPLEVGSAIGKVLYLSNYYKNIILLGVFDVTVNEKIMPSSLPDVIAFSVYTSQTAIQQDRWVIVGHEELKENQCGLTKRIVGGEVWLDDEKLRLATPDDIRLLPDMLVFGAGLVEKRAGQLIAKDKNSIKTKGAVAQL